MEKVFIWGTGFISQQIFQDYDVFSQCDVLGFIDNDIKKIGTTFQGKEIFEPAILHSIFPDKIVVLTDCYNEIKSQILKEFPVMPDIVENKNYFYKHCIMKRYRDSHDSEIKQILKYLEKNDLQVFNYDYVKKYEQFDIDILFDDYCGMYFTYHNSKKLYFARFLDTEQKVKEYYKSLLIEQDKESPHRYLDFDFNINEGDVVVDIGVAEGIFSLDIIEKVSRLYLIEINEEWIEAIQQTFKDYLDKIIIIKKFVTSIDEGMFATLDELIDAPVDFIKMDIEGNEWDALLGAEKLITQSPNMRCAICAYHGDFDEVLIRNALDKYKIKSSTTPGYMWFPLKIRQTYVSTRLVRGIVRGRK
ncbi:MAG: hypothetical protein HDQ97_16845 [Lachnospiraceae bacterium]|nr:hypothetical protein [Lachnospiraceae bacterium]